MIGIVVTTYFPPGDAGRLRERALRRAVGSWADHLITDERVVIHFANDGRVVDGAVPDLGLQWPVSHSRRPHGGVGASWNRGVATLIEKYGPDIDAFLYAVDDWALTRDFDIGPALRFLRDQRFGVGMVRLGPPHPDITGRVQHTEYGWFLILDRHHYAFSQRPALISREFIQAYGSWPEGVDAEASEQLHSVMFNCTLGPDIALYLPHPWEHIDSVELAHIDPQTRLPRGAK